MNYEKTGFWIIFISWAISNITYFVSIDDGIYAKTYNAYVSHGFYDDHVLIEIEPVSKLYIFGVAIIKFTAFTAVLLKKIVLIKIPELYW